MNDEIKEIVDSSNIKLLQINIEENFPKSTYSNESVVNRVKNKFFKDIATQILPLCDGEKFISAETRENILRFKGEVILCSQREFFHVLKTVYEAGKTKQFTEILNVFDDEN